MNSCVLMARVIRNPELRYTPDNQIPVAEMLVEFAGLKDDDPPATLKVVGWGNLASDIQQQYVIDDQVIIQGSLRMNTLERPEGFKEKRAELNASRIYKLSSGMMGTSPQPVTLGSSNVVNFDSYKTNPVADYEDPALGVSLGTGTKTEPPAVPDLPSPPESDTDQDLDDIPF